MRGDGWKISFGPTSMLIPRTAQAGRFLELGREGLFYSAIGRSISPQLDGLTLRNWTQL